MFLTKILSVWEESGSKSVTVRVRILILFRPPFAEPVYKVLCCSGKILKIWSSVKRFSPLVFGITGSSGNDHQYNKALFRYSLSILRFAGLYR